MKKRITLFIVFAFISQLSAAQINERIWNYIVTYRDIAISEMQRTGIPASITLAQGLLESGIGESRLATEANNHFGIKCHDWTGPSVRYTDDAPNECFRKYNSALESYLDHSDFLTGRKRYQVLFTYDGDDYVRWAKGLKTCGYATNPKYADLLIQKIELYYLHIFDKPGWKDLWAIVETNRELSLGKIEVQPTYTKVSPPKRDRNLPKQDESTVSKIIEASKTVETKQKENSNTQSKSASIASNKNKKEPIKNQSNSNTPTLTKDYELLQINGCDAVIYNYPLTIADVAAKHQVKIKQLNRYNELDEFMTFQPNTFIFLKNKKRKYKGRRAVHQVEGGETIKSIAQQYGVQQTCLRKLNLLYPSQEPKVGELVYLKKKRKVPPKIGE